MQKENNEYNSSFRYYSTRKQQSISVQIMHGGDIHKLTITGDQEACIKDLMCEIERTFQIPVMKQKIIYKGMRLHEMPEARLSDLDVFPMSMIRLSGIRADIRSSVL